MYALAVQLDPSSAVAHNNLASRLAEQGRIEEAIRHFEDALTIDAQYATAHNNLGIVLARHGDLEEATRHFQRALQINPDFGDARRNLHVALARRAQKDFRVPSEATLGGLEDPEHGVAGP